MLRHLRERTGVAGDSRGDPNILISVVVSAATAVVVVTAPDMWERLRDDPQGFLAFVGLTLALQLVSIEVYGRG